MDTIVVYIYMLFGMSDLNHNKLNDLFFYN